VSSEEARCLVCLRQRFHPLRRLLYFKHRTRRQCGRLLRVLLRFLALLEQSQLPAMLILASTFRSWLAEIAAMRRFTKSNGLTEGFHRKMKRIQRRGYGFRNFQNYRLSVIAECGGSACLCLTKTQTTPHQPLHPKPLPEFWR
jgi:hypothetical protein